MEKGLMQNMQGDKVKINSEKAGNGSCRMEVKRYQLELDSETFTTFAFKTHPLAYLDAGLGDLPISDLEKIGTQPNMQEWGDSRTLSQAWDSGTVVIEDKVGNTANAVSQALSRLMAR